MSTQQAAIPFDTPTAIVEPEKRAKARGQALAGAANYRHLQLARETALELGKAGGLVSADDVRVWLDARFPGEDWGNRNWMGSCFKGPEWTSVGFIRSKAKGSHANLLRTWRLR